MEEKKGIIVVAIIAIVVIVGAIFIFKGNKNEDNETGDNAVVETIANEELSQTNGDESVISVEKYSKIEKAKITKSGDSTNLADSDKTGRNAAVLVKTANSITINDSEITTDGAGASGVAATANGAKATVNNTTIMTSNERSKGLVVSNGGVIDANNLNIITNGDKSSGAVTDYNGGTLNLKGCTIETSGTHSSGIYATDKINAENTKITTERSTAAVIDGSGEIRLTNCDLTSGGKRAVYLYFTGARPREEMKATFVMSGGSLNAKNGPAFYVTNTKGIISIDNVNLTAGTGIILNAITDGSELGMENKVEENKGGDAVFTAKNQKLEGGFVADKNSTLELKFSSGSKLKGYINKENTAKRVKLTVESGCTIELTDNCYVDEMDISGGATIIENGYKIIKK